MQTKILVKNRYVKSVYAVFKLFFLKFKFSNFINIFWYIRDLWKIKKNKNISFSSFILLPYLQDKTSYTPIEPVYFYQDTWAAKKIFENKPVHHYDIGSSTMTIAIISQFVPTTMIDIRTIDLSLKGLCFRKGSILDMPFDDNSLESVSSLCVVEHIGLGRYGDLIDAYGSEKAAKELQRVLAKNGNLYFSVPVDCECRVYFNAHRAFTRDFVLNMFSGLTLVEEKYHYGKSLYEEYDPKKGFGTGLFHFRKI